MQSERFSFNGWSMVEWLKGNWSTIKELFKVGAPLVLGLSLFQDNPALVGTVTVLGKLFLDSLQYFVTEYK